jgi:hypothetical protein
MFSTLLPLPHPPCSAAPGARRVVPRPPAAAALLAAALFSGCYYSRLLAFKSQLEEFDRFVEVREARSLAFVFREPVLQIEDFVSLTGVAPELIATPPAAEIRELMYRKARTATAAAPEVEIGLRLFFRQGLLGELHFPDKAVAVLGRDFIVAAARAAGQGRLNQRIYELDWRAIPADGRAPLPVPRMADIKAIIGDETGRWRSGPQVALFYVFEVKTADKRTENPGTLYATFFVNPDTDEIASAVLGIGRFTLATRF